MFGDFFVKKPTTPTILQMEAVECGAVALGIILAYYGRWCSLDALRIDCGVSRDGSRADNVAVAAEKHGMDVEAYQIEPEALSEVHLPAIIHWNFNHFVVLEKITETHVYINDPGKGPRKVSFEEFDQAFTGILIELKPSKAFEKQGGKPSVLKNLITKLTSSKPAVVYVMLTTLALAIPGITIPGLTKVFIDQVLVSQMSTWLYPVLIGLLIAAVFKGALTWLQQILLLRLETKLALSNSTQFFWHMVKLPMSFFSQRYMGDIQRRLESSDSIANLVSQQFGTSVVNVLLMLCYSFVMLIYSPVLTLLAVLFTGINILALYLINQKRANESHRQTQAMNKMMSTAISGIQMIETYKSTGAESDFFRQFSGRHTDYLQAEQDLSVIGQSLSALPNVLNLLAIAGILGYGGWLVMHGDMTIGGVIAFQMLYGAFNQPIAGLVALAGRLQEVVADLFRIEDVLNHKVAKRYESKKESDLPTHHKLKGLVELENVTFGYSPLAEPLLDNFSLKIEPGRRVALVGKSGSGKSTIAKLLSGHYTPWQGEVRVDGTPLMDIPNGVLTQSLAIVDQDIHFFEGTLKENLTLWDATLTDEAVMNACKEALIHDVITEDKPEGYATSMAEDGQNFSGGQRQRLEIARALAQKPSILILDEASSALDAKMESVIDSNIRKLGCTVLVVSHRLSTIRDCDEIIVLDAGCVVERGTHEGLMKQKGAYAQLIAKGA